MSGDGVKRFKGAAGLRESQSLAYILSVPSLSEDIPHWVWGELGKGHAALAAPADSSPKGSA